GTAPGRAAAAARARRRRPGRSRPARPRAPREEAANSAAVVDARARRARSWTPGRSPERIMTSMEEAEDFVPAEHPGPDVNVSHVERAASITLCTVLVALALSRRQTTGALTVGLLGAYMAWRGATGHCLLYEALDTGTAEDEEDDRLAAVGHDDASAEAAATIGRAPEAAYAFCRALDGAPRFMAFIE